MIVDPATAVCFLAALVCFAAACFAIWYAVVERRRAIRFEVALRDVQKRLFTYRQWSGDHIHVWADHLPEDGEQ